MNRNTLHIPATWRRRISNLCLLVGLSLVAAPPAMHAYGTWWENRQRDLFLADASEAPGPDTPTTHDVPPATDVPAVRDAPAVAAPSAPRHEVQRVPDKATTQAARKRAARRPGKAHPSNRVGQARASAAWRDSLLQIPSIGVEAVVKRAGGNWRWVKGPAYDPKSPAPGGPGNAVIAAHRNMWARTFENLPRVRPGDRIAIQMKGRRHIYVVQWSRRVRTSETGVLANTKEPCVTLYTCIVPYRANERWAVRGRLIASQSASAAALSAPSAGRLARSR